MFRVWLLALAIPVIACGVSEGIRANLDAQLRAEAHKQFPTANADAVARFSVDRFCAVAAADAVELCATSAHLHMLTAAGVGAGLLGAGLLMLIGVGGRIARKSRTLLVRIFTPGLYVAAIAIIVLVSVHSAIAIATIYYGGSAAIGGVPVGIIAAIAIGAISGIVGIAKGLVSAVRRAQAFAIGHVLTRQDAPRLWKLVDDTAARLQALPPEHVIVGLDPTFYVTEANVVTPTHKLTGRTLYCSLALARILDTHELTAILGHELGHFKGEDTQFSVRFYPIYRGAVNSIVALHAAGSRGFPRLTLLPAMAILGYFLESFHVVESTVSRERELAADQTGAAATDATAMASALVKVHAFSGLWGEFQQAAANSLEKGEFVENASLTYAEAVRHHATPAAFAGIVDPHLSHPTDSHPPLSVRLDALGITLSDVTERALTVGPREPAIALIDDYERHEQEI